MKISLIFFTYRPGWLDMLAHSLRQQLPNGFDELVVVDECPGRVESGVGEKFLRDQGIPVGWYGPPKPRTFPWAVTGFVNAMNTGLLHASGDWVVFLHDFVMLPPDSGVKWRNAIISSDGMTLIHGVGEEYSAPKPDVVEQIRTWSYGIPKMVYLRDWRPNSEEFEIGYWAAPMAFFEACNGIDERADFKPIWGLSALRTQARLHGYSLKVDQSLTCAMIDHRLWQGPVSQQPHAMSNWRMIGEAQCVPIEPVWTKWSANSFHFKDERLKNGVA